MDPKIMVWRWFGATYGWTPDQVEAAPLEVQAWFPLIEKAAQKAQEKLSKRDTKTGR